MVTIRVYDFLRQWRFSFGSYGLTELPRGQYKLSFEASSWSRAGSTSYTPLGANKLSMEYQ